jgi:hypothetical protein
MNMSGPVEWSRPQTDDTSVVDPQLSPTASSISPTLPELSASEAGYAGTLDQRDDAPSTKAETVGSNKLKKKLSELDIRGAMADFDIRKGGKRHGIEDFYIELDQPHRMFYCPGDVVKGTYYASRPC